MSVRCSSLLLASIQVALSLSLTATAGSAQEIAGWQPLHLQLQTIGADAACAFVIAHWYEVEGPVARPGLSAEAMLLVRPETGEIALLNMKGDRMRLEQIACGATDKNRADRNLLSVERMRSAPSRLTVLCEGTPLSCRWKN